MSVHAFVFCLPEPRMDTRERSIAHEEDKTRELVCCYCCCCGLLSTTYSSLLLNGVLSEYEIMNQRTNMLNNLLDEWE